MRYSHKRRAPSLAHAVAFFALVAGASPALAQETGAPSEPAAPAIDQAQARNAADLRVRQVEVARAIDENRFDEAWATLEAMSPEQRAHPQSMFLEALLSRRTGDPRHAIDIYQRMLSGNSGLLRVRLELAQAYGEIDDDRAAEQNYRLALASAGVPDGVQRRIQRELAALGERRRWLFQVGFAVAPDSNINGATDAERTEIFGLPFELSDDARRRGGINFTGFLSADRFIRISPTSRLRLSGYTRATDNEGSRFDDYMVGLRAGPELRFGQSMLALSAVGEHRWFANRDYSDTVGGRAELTLPVGRLTHYAIAGSIVNYDEEQADLRDGLITGLDVVRTRYISETKYWRLSTSVRRADSEAGFEAYSSARIAIGGYSTLPFGFAMYLEPAVSMRDYDSAHPFYGVEREDDEWSITGRLMQRNWTIGGLTPYVGVTHLDNQSNIEVQDFERDRFEFGFTRAF